MVAAQSCRWSIVTGKGEFFSEPSHEHHREARVPGRSWESPSRAKELRSMMGWYDGMGWGGWILMTGAMVVFWALLLFAVLALFRTQRSGGSTSDRRDPMQILDERFARGEIDEDEYYARSSVLRGSVR
jgi:putative membrane protein